MEVDSITESRRGLGNSISKGPQQVLKGKDEDVLFNIPNLVTVGCWRSKRIRRRDHR